MKWLDYIISDKDILMGKPTIKGTRKTVEHIFGLLAQGWSEGQILENYPWLTKNFSRQYFIFTGMPERWSSI